MRSDAVRQVAASSTNGLLIGLLACLPSFGQENAIAPPGSANQLQRTVNFRPVAAQPEAKIPPVLLSTEHEALCKIKVGDTMPAIRLDQLGSGQAELSRLSGRAATVVAFWNGGGSMSRMLLRDLGPDVVEPYGPRGVSVVGIAVNQRAGATRGAVERAGASFPNLIDPDGTAFALVGRERLPRVYLLDAQGKVLWFDIEYTLATRRELKQAVRAVIEGK
jgi:hypothetical protein